MPLTVVPTELASTELLIMTEIVLAGYTAAVVHFGVRLMPETVQHH